MTGPQHYAKAERLLEMADEWEKNITDDLDSYESINAARQAAQVHAELALVAATIEQTLRAPALCREDQEVNKAWVRAIA